jgi:hypothetical protein
MASMNEGLFLELEEKLKQAREQRTLGALGEVSGFRLHQVETPGGGLRTLAFFTYPDHIPLATDGKLGDLVRTRKAYLPLSRVDTLVDYLEVRGKLAGVMTLKETGSKPRLLEKSLEDGPRTEYPWV